MVVAIIPARYGSTRLPAKPLAEICGKPMIQWVYENSKKSKLCTRVFVATDDERVQQAVLGFGGEVIMTSPEIQSGTDRMAAVASMLKAGTANLGKLDSELKAASVFVNVQGDEPLITGQAIDRAIEPILEGKFKLSSLRVPLKNTEDLLNKNVVKVIVDDSNRALYFSRYPIPYSRVAPDQAEEPFLCSQHVGIYAYELETLLQVSSLPQTALERAESLEQLRAMKAGIPIGVFEVQFESVGSAWPASPSWRSRDSRGEICRTAR